MLQGPATSRAPGRFSYTGSWTASDVRFAQNSTNADMSGTEQPQCSASCSCVGTLQGAIANPASGPYNHLAQGGLIWEQGVASSNPAAPTIVNRNCESDPAMIARIFKPARTAMQSGEARTKE